MTRQQQLLLLLGVAGIGYWLYQQQQQASQPAGAPSPDDATSFSNDPLAAVTELVMPWKSAGSKPKSVPDVSIGFPKMSTVWNWPI